MSYREKDIAYENGRAWVLRERDAYTVYIAGLTHSKSDSAYVLTDDGFGIARARADYLSRTMDRRPL